MLSIADYSSLWVLWWMLKKVSFEHPWPIGGFNFLINRISVARCSILWTYSLENCLILKFCYVWMCLRWEILLNIFLVTLLFFTAFSLVLVGTNQYAWSLRQNNGKILIMASHQIMVWSTYLEFSFGKGVFLRHYLDGSLWLACWLRYVLYMILVDVSELLGCFWHFYHVCCVGWVSAAVSSYQIWFM